MSLCFSQFWKSGKVLKTMPKMNKTEIRPLLPTEVWLFWTLNVEYTSFSQDQHLAISLCKCTQLKDASSSSAISSLLFVFHSALPRRTHMSWITCTIYSPTTDSLPSSSDIITSFLPCQGKIPTHASLTEPCHIPTSASPSSTSQKAWLTCTSSGLLWWRAQKQPSKLCQIFISLKGTFKQFSWQARWNLGSTKSAGLGYCTKLLLNQKCVSFYFCCCHCLFTLE